MKHLLTLALTATLVATSSAQIIVSRDTTMRYNYLHGFAANGVSDDVEFNETTLVDTFTNTMSYASGNNGTWQNLPWEAGVTGQLDQEFTVTPGGNGFSRIQSTAQTLLSSYQSHVGSVLNYSANPGNQLIMRFDVANTADYTLTGNVTVDEDEAGAGTLVALQRFDGIVWQQVHTTLFLDGYQGDFDHSGNLDAGEYRLVSQLGMTISGNTSVAASYNYDFQVVPEPATLTLALPLLLALRRRKQKNV